MNVVFTNGVYDILHRGHLELLRACRQNFYNEARVVVGINSDASVKRLKGDFRPIHCEADRKFMLESLKWVDDVIVFEEDTPLNLIKALRPDIIVKGGDYRPQDVAGFEVCPVHIVPISVDFKNGLKYSTTELIERAKNNLTKPQT
jgi:D-beta-D-heptose 7-phosphate kinase/D-beta-D-heptose 1-phosphate adenosyltransferase